jgi:hypothetical protein
MQQDLFIKGHEKHFERSYSANSRNSVLFMGRMKNFLVPRRFEKLKNSSKVGRFARFGQNATTFSVAAVWSALN